MAIAPSARAEIERRPPMQLQDLMDATALDPEVVRTIGELIETKEQAREKAPARRSARLEALITDELQQTSEVPERRDDAAFAEEADAFFVELVLPGG